MDRFARDGQVIELELQGHRTLYPDKGKNGKILATVRIVEESERWLVGNDVHSRHNVKLSDALRGCKIDVPTVYGVQQIEIKAASNESQLPIRGVGMKASST